MQLPEELQTAIEKIVEKAPSSALKRAREELTRVYREGGVSGFHEEAKRLAYLAARMPATYVAARKALEKVPFPVSSVCDLGAGPGTASWAACDLFPEIEKIVLIEASAEAIELGKRLAEAAPYAALREADWRRGSLAHCEIPEAELGVFSYVLNELEEPQKLVERAWERFSVLVLIEPGTPKGFGIVRVMRERLLEMGAWIAAPCPHRLACPSDWCHFAARVERSRLHRQLKEGALGYEDEKFSYLIASKTAVPHAPSRIVRHPQKLSGHVRLSLCQGNGKLEEKTVSRKDKELYRQARDAEWGDAWV